MSGIVGSRFNIRGSGVVGKLGTDGQVFTSAGAGKSAVFEAASGAKIGQVLQTTTTSYTTMNSTTYTNPMSRTITPVATSSKVLVMCSANHGTGGSNYGVQAKLTRVTGAGSESQQIGDLICRESGETTGNENGRSTVSFWLDSPSRDDEVTYKYEFKSSSSGDSVYFNNYGAGGQNTSTLTVLEILA